MFKIVAFPRGLALSSRFTSAPQFGSRGQGPRSRVGQTPAWQKHRAFRALEKTGYQPKLGENFVLSLGTGQALGLSSNGIFFSPLNGSGPDLLQKRARFFWGSVEGLELAQDDVGAPSRSPAVSPMESAFHPTEARRTPEDEARFIIESLRGTEGPNPPMYQELIALVRMKRVLALPDRATRSHISFKNSNSPFIQGMVWVCYPPRQAQIIIRALSQKLPKEPRVVDLASLKDFSDEELKIVIEFLYGAAVIEFYMEQVNQCPERHKERARMSAPSQPQKLPPKKYSKEPRTRPPSARSIRRSQAQALMVTQDKAVGTEAVAANETTTAYARLQAGGRPIAELIVEIYGDSPTELVLQRIRAQSWPVSVQRLKDEIIRRQGHPRGTDENHLKNRLWKLTRWTPQQLRPDKTFLECVAGTLDLDPNILFSLFNRAAFIPHLTHSWTEREGHELYLPTRTHAAYVARLDQRAKEHHEIPRRILDWLLEGDEVALDMERKFKSPSGQYEINLKAILCYVSLEKVPSRQLLEFLSEVTGFSVKQLQCYYLDNRLDEGLRPKAKPRHGPF